MPSSVIHLDTCFLIRALIPGSEADTGLRAWLAEERQLAMSSVAWTEFLCGPLSDQDYALAARVVTERIPFDEGDAASAAEFFNRTDRRRGSLTDCMIAAAACRRGALLATLNLEDFRRFEKFGLRL